MVDEELEADLDEEHEADEDETSACAPLPGAPDVMSRSTDTGSKGYPLFRIGTGRKGGQRHLPREYLAKFFRSTY